MRVGVMEWSGLRNAGMHFKRVDTAMRPIHKAFTLVEVLIVVIVLGILAAIVLPQFTDASSDAKLSSLKTNLQTIRGQLQLYKIQHDDNWPALATFTAEMTTEISNKGPYLLSIPNNPYTETNTMGAGALDSSAWYYNETTGVFRANDTGHDSY
jgi:general secretion pathway protein G